MNKKTMIILFAALICLAVLLSGCGKSKSSDSPAPKTEPEIVLQIPEGVYVEELAHRGMLFVSSAAGDVTAFRIEWPSSAFERTRWEMTGTYDAAKNALVYSDAVRVDTIYDDQGRGTDSVVYTHGTGSFSLTDNKIVWTNDKGDQAEPSTFVYEMSLDEYNRSQSADPQPAASDAPVITPNPTETPTVLPTPSPAPTSAPSPTPTPSKLPIIKKHPTDETVKAGGNCMFIAKYENAIWAVWHFLSPDGKTDIAYDAINNQFPTLEVINGMYSTMTLRNIPYELNGWKVFCRYSNNDGYTDTNAALITVQPGPTPTPTPAPTAIPTLEPTPEPTPNLGPVVNEWKDTDSIIEATYGAGFNFSPPVDQAIPEGLTLKGYRYRVGTLEADYADADGNVKLIIRKSNTDSGLNLAGDYNAYSKSWDHTLKGLTVHCCGDGERSNTTYYDAGDLHFSISYNMGKEGEGLTLDEINSIVNCIQ